MNKAELIRAISLDTGMTKVDTARAVNGFLRVIQNAIKANQEVALVGFGSFSVRNMGVRVGRNFRTKSLINIPPRKSVRFKPGKALKNAIN